MAQARRQCTVSANVDKEGSACFDLKFVQPFNGVLAAASLGSSSVSTEFALRLDSERARRGLFFGTEFARQSKELAACGYVDLSTQSLCHVSGKLWNGTWRLTTDWSLRDLDMRQPQPSLSLQQERLRSLKTSLKASLSYRYTQLTAELAGPPGDVAFGKLHALAEATIRSRESGDFWPWHLHLAGVMGLLLPVGKSCAQDRFHLGGASGPFGLKGFAENGAEPRARRMSETFPKDKEHNALGGEAVASVFLGASRPLDIPSLEGLRLMAFTSLGVLHPSVQRGTAWASLSPLRASLGCGLVLPLGPGMLELTFTQPVRWTEHDVRQDRKSVV